jgi:hypothetical protein
LALKVFFEFAFPLNKLIFTPIYLAHSTL